MADLFDIAVARKLSGGSGGGGGGTTVEALSVTQNGTYTAPTGKAYSPVTVNVSGGGSSDFSTAEVTIINNTGDDLDLENSMPRIIDDYEEGENAIITWISVSANSSEVLTGVLYQGVSVIRFMASTDVAITGNATKETVAIFQDVTITGDCTITIS